MKREYGTQRHARRLVGAPCCAPERERGHPGPPPRHASPRGDTPTGLLSSTPFPVGPNHQQPLWRALAKCQWQQSASCSAPMTTAGLTAHGVGRRRVANNCSRVPRRCTLSILPDGEHQQARCPETDPSISTSVILLRVRATTSENHDPRGRHGQTSPTLVDEGMCCKLQDREPFRPIIFQWASHLDPP